MLEVLQIKHTIQIFHARVHVSENMQGLSSWLWVTSLPGDFIKKRRVLEICNMVGPAMM